MSSSDKPSPQPDVSSVAVVASELLLGLATGPLLALLVGGKGLSQGLQEIGLMSEEIFRGDRLPLLSFPSTSDPSSDTDESV